MAYTREELDWMEAEWAFHLHGRSAFLSREDFQQLQAWEAQGVAADTVVKAMEAFFQRRAMREKARGFVAMRHLEKDVAKAHQVRTALRRAGAETPTDVAGWGEVGLPLQADPRARAVFETWKRLEAATPGPDSPGYLDHHDAVRTAFRAFLALAEEALGPRRSSLAEELEGRLREAHLAPGTLVWERAWDHHWGRTVCEAWGIRP